MRTGSYAKSIVLAAGLLAIAGAGFAGGLYYTQTAQIAQAQSKGTNVQSALWTDGNPALVKTTTPPSFSELAKAASPAVVFISTKQKVESRGSMFPPGHPFNDFFFGPPGGGVQQGLGSGFIINKEGYILTNQHVIDGADEIQVTLLSGDKFPAKIIGEDDKTDVALLKIDVKRDLPFLSLGNSEAMEVGDWVVAIGNPFGLDHTVTAGIVSAKGRAHVDPGKVKGAYRDFIQTDASINPGNSGGPLLNVHGEVIGINTAINAAGQGIGFAIPIRMVKDILPQLASNGKVARSWMGVLIQPVTAELYQGLGLSRAEGALIAEVVPGGPADQAGIKPGDVIVSFGGKEIKRSEDLRWTASTYGTDKKAEVKLIRDGKPLTLSIKLRPFPSEEELAKVERRGFGGAHGDIKTEMGLMVRNVDHELSQKTGVPEGEGVYVVDVSKDSPAYGRIMPGDVILSLGERARLSSGHLKGVEDFQKSLKSVSSGKTVLAYVLRDGEHLFIAFTKP